MKYRIVEKRYSDGRDWYFPQINDGTGWKYGCISHVSPDVFRQRLVFTTFGQADAFMKRLMAGEKYIAFKPEQNDISCIKTKVNNLGE